MSCTHKVEVSLCEIKGRLLSLQIQIYNNNSQIVPACTACGEISMYTILSYKEKTHRELNKKILYTKF